MAPLEKDTPLSQIEILSLTKPHAQRTFECAWANDGHAIKKGLIYVRVVWKYKGQTKVESDHICVSCWSKPV